MKIAIITTFFEGEKYLENYFRMLEANERCLKTAFEDIKLSVIFVNDSPLVNLTELVNSYKNSEYDVDIIENKTNSGIHYSRIEGLNRARFNGADYIMFLDQDDELREDAIKTFATYLTSNKPTDILISNALLEQKNWKGTLVRSTYQSSLIWDLETYIKVGTQIISPGQCLINVKAIPKKWSDFVIKNNGADDYYLWLLMLGEGKKHLYVDEALYIHKYTSDNISSDTKKTDESTYEFIPMLRESKVLSEKNCNILYRMIKYKAGFRGGGLVKKMLLSLLNIDLFIFNYNYKKKTKTPLGFNR